MQHLGIKRNSYNEPASLLTKEKEKNIVDYPSLLLKDEQVNALGTKTPQVGKTGKAIIKYRINSHEENAEDKYGSGKKNTRLEITHMEPHTDGDTVSEDDFKE